MTYPDKYSYFGIVRDIFNQEDGSLYLRRIYLLPFLYLHFIAQADADRHLHNHPWSWCRSLIIRGGYLEERSRNRFFWRRPFSWLRLTQHSYHRIALVEPNTWTLFFVGPRVQSWGFKVGERHVDQQEYLSAFHR